MMAALILVSLAPQLAPAASRKAAIADDKLVCKNEDITGSLAGHRRVCHTKADWQQIIDNANATGREMTDRATLQSSNGGG